MHVLRKLSLIQNYDNTSVVVQEQEKQRSIEKKKEEVEKKGLERRKEEADGVQKLQVKLKQEQQRWDKECLAREKQQVGFVLTFFKCAVVFLTRLSGLYTHIFNLCQAVNRSYLHH